MTRRPRHGLAPHTKGGLLAAGLLLSVLHLAIPAQAATRFVATTGSNAGPNDCLSAASPCQTITHALTQAVANDTIQVAAGSYDTTLGEAFPLLIAVNLTLTGAGAPTTIIDATGANARVITVSGGMTVMISDVTITGGAVSCVGSCIAEGGGVFNNGSLTLTNVTVSGNTATSTNSTAGPCHGEGGGLFSNGMMTVTNSTVSGNTASSTNSGNGACHGEGGGLFSNGILTVTNSTVSGNTASCTNSGAGPCHGDGGGLFSNGSMTLTNVTVSGNTVSCANSGAGPCHADGGGLFNNGILTLTATIIALQLAGTDCDGSVAPMSTGSNLDSDNTCNLLLPTDKPGITSPGLGPLRNNGGPTQTHALLPGSRAIDMVLTGCPPPATDQRGVSRPQGAACDIGAYEREGTKAAAPTLSEWVQLALVGLLLGGGLFALRRRVRPPQLLF